MSKLEMPLAEGGLEQIDYDDKHRITVLHLRSAYGERTLVRISYPEAFDLVDVVTDRNPVVILNRDRQPEVSVVKLV
jgi:hypothetical protein